VTDPATGSVLPVAFFQRPAEDVARALLGMMVVSRIRGVLTAGRIVETEAYLGAIDPAAHAYRHRLHAGNASLYAPPATWYVYRSYGIHWCMNLVCQGPEAGAAVLLRALEPTTGVATMRRRRGNRPDRELAAGPGRLTQALGITRSLDGWHMPVAKVVVAQGEPVVDAEVAVTPRVGITKAADWPLRYVIAGSPWVSGGRARKSRASDPGSGGHRR
jgi:DNA-3-methyladenine glycosylase